MKNSIKKRDIVILFVLILILVVLILGATYAYMSVSAVNNSAAGEAGCFEVDYTGNAINATNLASTTNYLEGAKTVVTLSKADGCEIYTSADIYIKTNDSSTAPIDNPKALKYKIFQGNFSDGSTPTGAAIGEGYIDDLQATIKIASVNLTTTATNYTIYIWIDSDLSDGEYNGKTYSGYIYAESVQSSTITE